MGILQPHEDLVLAHPFLQNERLICHSQVVLGTPSAGCSGVGICKMYLTSQVLPIPCPVIGAWLINNDTSRLRVNFSKAGMESRYLKRHFRWNLFQVLEVFELPDWIPRKLGLAQTRIAPGIYSVWETEEAFIVDF